jgi:hypothetical protein
LRRRKPAGRAGLYFIFAREAAMTIDPRDAIWNETHDLLYRASYAPSWKPRCWHAGYGWTASPRLPLQSRPAARRCRPRILEK